MRKSGVITIVNHSGVSIGYQYEVEEYLKIPSSHYRPKNSYSIIKNDSIATIDIRTKYHPEYYFVIHYSPHIYSQTIENIDSVDLSINNEKVIIKSIEELENQHWEIVLDKIN